MRELQVIASSPQPGGIDVGDWYAVQVKRHNERRGEQQLTLRGIPVLLPFIEVVRRYRTRRVVLLEPLFPGYLFARMEAMDEAPERWQALRWAPGVRRVLGTSDVPTPVDDGVVEAIRDRTRELGFVRPTPGHVPGSRVRIRGGPMAGLEAVFDRQMSRTGRVRVLLELLGQEARVEVDAFDLEMV
ncbi:MAG TPA: transcription termination/antitermination NusG family protein [Candidatus Methylomirabilis sp.]|nr:transcription termination/antitermination NusG family protein [Candidatus Methylomirabilis sp.]